MVNRPAGDVNPNGIAGENGDKDKLTIFEMVKHLSEIVSGMLNAPDNVGTTNNVTEWNNRFTRWQCYHIY